MKFDDVHLHDLKQKAPAELLGIAEELEIENASTLRKQDMMFAILKELAEQDVPITGDGVLEVLQDGFGFLRSPESNYLPGPDDIYVSPSQVRRFGLRTGDTVEGTIRAPKDGERYFALLKVNKVNFDDPEHVRHRINFDNLTPLYPEEKLGLEIDECVPLQLGEVANLVDQELRALLDLLLHLVGSSIDRRLVDPKRRRAPVVEPLRIATYRGLTFTLDVGDDL